MRRLSVAMRHDAPRESVAAMDLSPDEVNAEDNCPIYTGTMDQSPRHASSKDHSPTLPEGEAIRV